jgi:hypothetical protein
VLQVKDSCSVCAHPQELPGDFDDEFIILLLLPVLPLLRTTITTTSRIDTCKHHGSRSFTHKWLPAQLDIQEMRSDGQDALRRHGFVIRSGSQPRPLIRSSAARAQMVNALNLDGIRLRGSTPPPDHGRSYTAARAAVTFAEIERRRQEQQRKIALVGKILEKSGFLRSTCDYMRTSGSHPSSISASSNRLASLNVDGLAPAAALVAPVAVELSSAAGRLPETQIAVKIRSMWVDWPLWLLHAGRTQSHCGDDDQPLLVVVDESKM